MKTATMSEGKLCLSVFMPICPENLFARDLIKSRILRQGMKIQIRKWGNPSPSAKSADLFDGFIKSLFQFEKPQTITVKVDGGRPAKAIQKIDGDVQPFVLGIPVNPHRPRQEHNRVPLFAIPETFWRPALLGGDFRIDHSVKASKQ